MFDKILLFFRVEIVLPSIVWVVLLFCCFMAQHAVSRTKKVRCGAVAFVRTYQNVVDADFPGRLLRSNCCWIDGDRKVLDPHNNESQSVRLARRCFTRIKYDI